MGVEGVDVVLAFLEHHAGPVVGDRCDVRLPVDEAQPEVEVRLESHYERGPFWTLATTFPRDVWLLSNHKKKWLDERLARFGVGDRFDRIIVSDEIAAAKPDPRAFCSVSEQCLTRSVMFVDDQIHNAESPLRSASRPHWPPQTDLSTS